MPTKVDRKAKVRRVDKLRRDQGMTQAEACKKVGISPASYRRWKADSKSFGPRHTEPSTPFIFISHRHDDRVIADALRRQLLNWDFTEEQIFQSSHPKSGPTIGSSIKRSIGRALSKANVVILVFTYEHHDWQYCMWEVGLATDPNPNRRRRTRIIALQCFSDEPKVFKDDLIVPITYNDVYKLVRQIHKDDDFFPGLSAYRPNIAAEALRDRTRALRGALQKAANEVGVPTAPETTIRWGFITLSLNASAIEELVDAQEKDQVKIREKLVTQAKVVYADKKGLEHFGFDNPTIELKKKPPLQRLVNNWKRRVEDPSPSSDWADELCDELHNAIQNWQAKPSWRPFRSASEDTYVYPLVNTVRTLPEESMEFDVYVYRIPRPKNSN